MKEKFNKKWRKKKNLTKKSSKLKINLKIKNNNLLQHK